MQPKKQGVGGSKLPHKATPRIPDIDRRIADLQDAIHKDITKSPHARSRFEAACRACAEGRVQLEAKHRNWVTRRRRALKEINEHRHLAVFGTKKGLRDDGSMKPPRKGHVWDDSAGGWVPADASGPGPDLTVKLWPEGEVPREERLVRLAAMHDFGYGDADPIWPTEGDDDPPSSGLCWYWYLRDATTSLADPTSVKYTDSYSPRLGEKYLSLLEGWRRELRTELTEQEAQSATDTRNGEEGVHKLKRESAVTLREFMVRKCDPLGDPENPKHQRKRYTAAVRRINHAVYVSKDKLTLPELARPWDRDKDSGKAKQYREADLRRIWPTLEDEISSLPKLKSSEKTSTEAPTKSA